jgi:tetratricopeptide (TPR) repeat protein
MYVTKIIHLKRLLLTGFVLSNFIISSNIRGEEHLSIEEKIKDVDRLVYEKGDFDTALKICKEILQDSLGKHVENEIENTVNLIENYSDYDQKPLQLFFKASKHLNPWGIPKKEASIIFQEILNEFPDCKLAPFLEFLLARNKGDIEGYKRIVDKFPNAVFPISSKRSSSYKRGLHIAPNAQVKIALHYAHSKEPNYNQALKEFQILIDKYPDAIDFEGDRIIIEAYFGMLNIYKVFKDEKRVKGICNIFLNEFPNEGFTAEYIDHFGETHPEAYLTLATIESNKKKKIKLYEKVVLNYSESTYGRPGTCGVGAYWDNALNAMIHVIKEPKLIIKKFRKLQNSKLDNLHKGLVQLKIARIYEKDLEDYNRALVEYKIIAKSYNNVFIEYWYDNTIKWYGFEPLNLSDLAKEEIKRIKSSLNREN